MRIFHIVSVYLALFITVGPTFAQGKDQPQFSHLDIKNGLSHNQATCFLKDSEGYIWIGTSSGLNRFDGFGVKVFLHDSRDPSSLRDNSISKLFEGPDGNIWIKTTKGLSIYNVKTEKFNSNFASYLKQYALPNAVVEDIIKDKEGNFWFLQPGYGITRYNPSSKKVTRLQYTSGKAGAIGSNHVNALAIATNGDLWAVHQNGLLEKIDDKTLQVTQRETLLLNQIGKGKDIGMRVTLDKDNDVWVHASYESIGAYHYKPSTKTFTHFSQNSAAHALNSDLVRGIAQDADGKIWLATDHGGVNVVDKKDLSVRYVTNCPEDEHSLSHNSIISLYKDQEGIIWLGTFKEGVNYYHKNFLRFQHHKNQILVKGSLPYDDINRFVEDKKGNLWIGTNGGGLLYWDRKSNTYTRYQHNPKDTRSLSSDVIVSLLLDKNQTLWIGTYLGGLNKFDGKQFTRYAYDPKNRNSLSDNSVWELFEDTKGKLWVGTLRGGLQYLDTNNNTFHKAAAGNTYVKNAYVSAVAEDQKGNLWIGGDNGVEVLNSSAQKITHYVNNPKNAFTLSSNNILAIYRDGKNQMWVATAEGLNLFNEKEGRFKVFTKKDGLSDNIILTIQEDKGHNLWVSTPKGLSRIKLQEKEGALSLDVRNYDEHDGLQGKAFNENAALLTKKGEMVFGGANGFNLFKPSALETNKEAPKVVFTDFQLFNHSLQVGEELDGDVVLTSSLSNTKEITLEHNQNVFTVEFAALNFFHSEKNKYKYKLEGFDKNWHTTDSYNRKITYTNLDPGEYELKVLAANNDGVWNTTGSSLKFVVNAPWWRTNIAYAIYLLLIGGALVLIRKVEMQKTIVQFELERERREAKHMQELNLMKIKFFTNISHEFRTPLTLILAPLEKLLANTQDPNQQKQFQMINRNAKRLLNLVNQLLDFRKIEVQEVAFNPSVGNIVKFIKEAVYSFSDLSEKNHVSLSFESKIQELQASFDMDKLGKILFNLLSNAFKFTPENGKIQVEVNCFDNDSDSAGLHLLEIKVTDTGIGIPQENLAKIFERFHQEDLPKHLMNQGSGIGLAITKEFVKVHGGIIDVKSEVGAGSCFTVTIPIKVTGAKVETLVAEQLEEVEIVPVKPMVPKRAAAEVGHPLTVLVVEDSDDFRNYLKDSLSEHFNVLEAANGSEGWQKALACMPDLIISDFVMPEMNGIDFCKKIKHDARTSQIPFILLTAQTGEEHKLKGLGIGANDYVTKPFNFDMLLSRINNLISQCQLLQKAYEKKISVQTSEINIVSLDDKLIQKAIKVVEENIDSADFSVELMSKELGMSRVHLYKKIVALTGQSPVEFIRKIRLERAAQLLEKSQLSVAEVAYAVGFNNPRYFSKYFKEAYHMLPSVYAETKHSKAIM